jgi:hypothetical protein
MQWTPERSEHYDFIKDVLNSSDWEELRHFKALLRPFNKATKNAEGNASTGSHGAL